MTKNATSIENFYIYCKKNNSKMSILTCYDYWSSSILQNTNVDAILVGDSLSMVVYGHNDTTNCTVDMIANHTSAVRKGSPNKFIISDLPFMSYNKGLYDTMKNVEKIIQSGANSIKIEGVDGNEDTIKNIINAGVPVMGHIGLIPQHINKIGGFKRAEDSEENEKILIQNAIRLEELGCYSIVLECVPDDIAKKITQSISIPTIGIGSGENVDGQVLVLQDLLGFNSYFKPSFVNTYMDGAKLMNDAISKYIKNIKAK